jgi:hypothetical protein
MHLVASWPSATDLTERPCVAAASDRRRSHLLSARQSSLAAQKTSLPLSPQEHHAWQPRIRRLRSPAGRETQAARAGAVVARPRCPTNLRRPRSRVTKARARSRSHRGLQARAEPSASASRQARRVRLDLLRLAWRRAAVMTASRCSPRPSPLVILAEPDRIRRSADRPLVSFRLPRQLAWPAVRARPSATESSLLATMCVAGF